MRFGDFLNALGNSRDYLILALCVLVLVEGGIIVLWARRSSQLSRELGQVAAAADAARVAAERAAATVNIERRQRAVYSVAAQEKPAPTPRWTPPAPATEAPAPLQMEPDPEPEPAPVEAAAPPVDPVSPAVEKAAAWVIPDVAASQSPAPTTLGWSATPVPVEPAADFAVVRDGEPPRPAPPRLSVLDGTQTWTIPAVPVAEPHVPTHFDPALFDGIDDTVVDDTPPTGDILLVEDDPTIAKLYRVLLESRGYTVRHACDGLEGLDAATEKRPDLVLLDIMMPRMNGIAFLQALRSGEMRDLPVVVLSNFMEKQLVDDAMSLGALEYMVKAQTRPEALVGALPHWLRGERAFSF